jgi:hypothetical protein
MCTIGRNLFFLHIKILHIPFYVHPSPPATGAAAIVDQRRRIAKHGGRDIMKKALGIVGLFAAFTAMPAAAQSISLHGFADVSFKNDYVTPRGLAVTTEGDTVQALDGLVLDVPLDPKGVVTDVSFVGGTWTDWNPGYDSAHNKEGFNEFDWFVSANAKIYKDWKVGAQYGEFISPQQAFVTEKNFEFSLAFDDSPYMKEVNFQPYVKLFYAAAGGSTVVVGKAGGTFDVEVGASPNLDLHRYNVPLILSAPTWVTLGPSSFWGGGGNVGVFSTGLKATYPLPLPGAAGHWSIYGSYQYYDLINGRLVLAEDLLNGKADRNVNVFSVGLGLGF